MRCVCIPFVYTPQSCAIIAPSWSLVSHKCVHKVVTFCFSILSSNPLVLYPYCIILYCVLCREIQLLFASIVHAHVYVGWDMNDTIMCIRVMMLGICIRMLSRLVIFMCSCSPSQCNYWSVVDTGRWHYQWTVCTSVPSKAHPHHL